MNPDFEILGRLPGVGEHVWVGLTRWKVIIIIIITIQTTVIIVLVIIVVILVIVMLLLWKEAITVPGVLVVRIDGPLFYANSERFQEQVETLIYTYIYIYILLSLSLYIYIYK